MKFKAEKKDLKKINSNMIEIMVGLTVSYIIAQAIMEKFVISELEKQLNATEVTAHKPRRK